ncbi:voltage-dependent anion channel [Pisolithus croceorrhizus]|nr:voltage-dependent anion channel [Pisolithus croceorrhizus]KAI6169301.1 voltage-dependent anion channel [Pisolithus thermaeus]
MANSHPNFNVSSKKSSKHVIRHFTPAWFTITMGTGSIAVICHSFPYNTQSPVATYLALAFFFLDLALFLLFTAISLARYTLYPNIWHRMIHHPVQSLYLGTFPMGAATLLTVAISVFRETFDLGRPLVYTVWVLWWVDVIILLLCFCGTLHMMQGCQKHSLESMTLRWLLPVVTLIVVSSAGGVIAPIISAYSTSGALITLTFCVCMVAVALPVVMMMLTIYLLRCMIYGYPQRSLILSSLFPLGPFGQSAYAILLIGSGLRSILPASFGDTQGLFQSATTPVLVETVCVMIALTLWAFETMWLAFALLAVRHAIQREGRFSFELSFWGLIFPNGVYANITISLGSTFSSNFFRVCGAAYAIATLLLWLYVFVQTVRILPSGRMFDSSPGEVEVAEENVSNEISIDGDKTWP